MMNKKVLVLAAVMLLASTGTAWVVGQFVTQDQFNQIDFDTQSLELEVVGKEKAEDRINVDVNYTTLQKSGENQWQIVEKTRTFFYRMQDYYDCRSGGQTRKECIAEAKAALKQKAINFRQAERLRLKQHQKQSFWGEIDVQEDIDINNEELN